jgi:predicted kinase
LNRLFIICGLSFAGKSTLGRAITERFGFEEVDVDVTKVQLYGSEAKDESLTPSDWNRIYAETDALIVALLQSGKTVVDASRNFSKAERQHIREIIAALDIETLTIYVDTPEAVARERLLENRRTKTRVDWPDAQFDELVRAMEPPGQEEDPLVFHYEDDIQVWITECIASLSASSNGSG